ncbi:MAG: hypothetical protein Q4E34_05565 [Synergistaceae bacterium]|nr:hypothetical protein [Synergistaceae bacterium]
MIFLFAALLAGIIFSLETKMHLFRLKDITAEPGKILPEQIITHSITAKQRRFWPVLFVQREKYCRKIEIQYPLTCRMDIAGWGKVKLKLKVLQPAAKIYWDGKYWYLSSNGKIWQTNIEENSILNLSELKDKPLIYWSDDQMPPCSADNSAGNIKTSSVRAENIYKWYENLKAVGWLDKIAAIKTETNDGISAVRIIFRKKNGGGGVSVLMPENCDDWVVAGLAVNKICSDLQDLPQTDFIDATYKNKILVKTVVQ